MPDRPNLILITTDQQRGDGLSINGHAELRTPFLDSLAARGVNFARAYSTCPVCMPARRTLLSGLNPASHGTNRNTEGEPFDPPATLPGLLRDAGYQTQLVGKLHVGVPGVRHGFDHIVQSETPNDRRRTAHQRRNDYADWFDRHGDAPHPLTHGVMSNDRTARPWTLPEHLHHTNWVTETAARFLDTARDPSVPFFLHLSYWAPHQPAMPPQPYWDRYADTAWSPTIGAWVGEREPRPGLPLDAMRGPFAQRDMREHARGYYGLIHHVDDQLNYLFDRWKSSPIYDRDRPTWVVFTSDHGEQLGEHHLFRKNAPYEGSARVPMFVAPLHGAAVDAPRTSDALACLEDVLPTCCGLAGIDPPSRLGGADGRSLLPVVRGDAERVRDAVVGECRWGNEHHRFVVRADENRKYIRWTGTGEEQCFDLSDDPGETKDVSEEVDLEPMRAEVDAVRDAGKTKGHDGDAPLQPCGNRPPRAVWGDR